MNSKTKTIKGLKAFNTFCFLGIAFAVSKLFTYLTWVFQLIKDWSLPETPFFSKVSLVNSKVEITPTIYVIFALAYIIIFCFIIIGLYQLIKATKLLANNQIFKEGTSIAFKRAGTSFLIFAYGTFIIDFIFLLWGQTSNKLFNLLSTELILFLVLGYLMYFLSSIFKEGEVIKKENDLTI